MVIANGADVECIYRIIEGEQVGTLFTAHQDPDFNLDTFLQD